MLLIRLFSYQGHPKPLLQRAISEERKGKTLKFKRRGTNLLVCVCVCFSNCFEDLLEFSGELKERRVLICPVF